jgi:soluble lytic murein transglycosylase
MKILRVFLILFLVGLACQMPQLPLQSSTPAPPTENPTITPAQDEPTLMPTAPAVLTPAAPDPSFLLEEPLPDTPLSRADQAVFWGDWPKALTEYQAAMESARDPESQAAAMAGLGRVYHRSGDAYNALQTLRRLLEVYPDSAFTAEAHYLLAQSNLELGRPAEAAANFQEYLDVRPGIIDAYIHTARGDALLSVGDYSQALTAYQAALASPHLTPNLDLEIKLAQAYVLIEDTATALVMYPDIYQRSSAEYQKVKVDLLLGRLYASISQPELAYAAWLDAVTLYPAYYDAYQCLVELVNAGYPVDELQRGIVDYYAGEYGVALAALDRALATIPDPASIQNPTDNSLVDAPQAYYFRGLVLRAMDDSANAIAMWDTVIQNYPQSPVVAQAWEQKAYTQWAFLDQYPEAIQSLLDFVAAYPVHERAAEFLFDAARVAERAGDLALAAQLWERMVSEYPTSTLAYEASFQAGIAQYRIGDWTAAQTQFLRAQQLASSAEDRARAYLWLGKSYQGLGDTAAARSTWQQTIEMDPTGYYSERARDILDERAPFTSPQVFDMGFDPEAERRLAENWMRSTFSLPEGIDLAAPGDLIEDGRLQRGLELWRLGEYALASVELENLRLSLSNDPVNTYRLVHILLENRIYRPANMAARQVLDIAGMDDASTLDAPKFFNRIRFGNYYAELVVPASQEFNLHPLFIWSVIRQESLFDATIQSSAGARGLMQIIPSTGQDIANRLGWPENFQPNDLFRPQVSIRLGLNYLNDQRTYLYEDLYAALAAYNAGPGNAAVWKALAPDDPDLLLEIIRFSEPQRYIKGIYEIFSIYRKLYVRESP